MKPNEKVVPAGAVVVPAAPAGPTAQLGRGAVAFGDFVQRVGLAVADAQARLDENMAATAERLSKTSVDVVAVFEQSVDDDGVRSDATAHVQRLPVTSFIMPKPYGWSRVALRAQLNVSEFNGADGFRIDALPPGRPALRSDSTTGTILLEAVLEPRAEVQAPTPLVVQRAPRFRVASQSAMDIVESGRVVGRELAVAVELPRARGPRHRRRSEGPRRTLPRGVCPVRGDGDAGGGTGVVEPQAALRRRRSVRRQELGKRCDSPPGGAGRVRRVTDRRFAAAASARGRKPAGE